MATDENAEHTCSLGENNPGSVQNGRTSSEMWSPDSWGLQNTMTIDYIQIELPWQSMSNKPLMENWSLELKNIIDVQGHRMLQNASCMCHIENHKEMLWLIQVANKLM